jgi:transposase
MKKQYHVNLTKEERNQLVTLLMGGTQKVREVKRAQILLKADDGWTDVQIAEALPVGRATVERIRKRYAEQGLAAALHDKKRNRIYERKMDGEVEAHLIALVNSPPPSGHRRWTLRLLADQLVQLEEVPIESISHETIRLTLKKTNLSLGDERNG